MDKRTLKLLKYINSSIKDDGYKVVDKSDFFEHLKLKKVNVSDLDNIINYLAKHFFIDIKYSDEKVYCFSVLNKTRLYFEKEKSPQKQLEKYRRLFFYYVLLAGVAAFIGATLAIKLFL